MRAPHYHEAGLSPAYNVLSDAEKAISGVAYKYISLEEFGQIKSVEESQLVYWSEIIQRVHVCGATTIKRLKKWYDAMIAAYDAKNYFGFCASLRGLVESCADSFHTTGKLIDPLSENFALIEQALNGRAKTFLLSREIEEELIHYVFARKRTPSEKETTSEIHEAKQVRDYLDSIGKQSIVDLYFELCQVSHPSAQSLLPFLLSTKEQSLVLHEEHIDKELNDNILTRHKATILGASNLGLLPAMCLLLLINGFDAPITKPLKTPCIALETAVHSSLWKDIETKIRASRKAGSHGQ